MEENAWDVGVLVRANVRIADLSVVQEKWGNKKMKRLVKFGFEFFWDRLSIAFGEHGVVRVCDVETRYIDV